MNGRTQNKHALQSGFFLISLCFFVMAAGCTNNADELRKAEREADSLLALSMRQEYAIDSLQQQVNSRSEVNPWFNPKFDGRAFLKQNIDNPESLIVQSLRDRPELIPLDPVLGGKMRFTDIQVLGSKWVIAKYEDGHIMGRSIYEYQLHSDGTLQFEVLASTRN